MFKRIQPLKNKTNTIITYTIIFSVLMVGVFAFFLIEGISFVNTADAYDQGYFWTVEMGDSLKSLFAGDGYPLWSWDRGPGIDTKLPIDPFTAIASLFPAGYIELGYTVAIVLRLYFAGIAFLFFCWEIDLDYYKSLIGAISYVFSTCTINISLVQGHFINLFVMFPLLIQAVDRIYKGKSPLMFMLCVGICVGLSYYLAYMAAIGVILYVVVRYFHYYSANAKMFAGYICKFIIYGIAGIMMSAIFVFVNIRILMGASTGTNPDIALLYDTAFYYGFAKKLISEGYAFGYQYIGIPILALLVIPVVKGRPTIKATHVIMALLMTIMSLFPFFGSLLNGFSYISNRWYFMLVFFLIWCAAEHMDLDELSKKKNIIIMFMWWIIIAVSTLGFSYFDISGDMSLRGAAFVGGNLLAGLVMIVFIALGKKLTSSLKQRQFMIALAVIGTLILVWNVSFYGRIEDRFCKFGAINKQLQQSTQRAGSLIEDEGFFRIDQNDWINIHLKADQPANENLWWKNNTIYLYDSKIPSRLSEFNKLLGNNLGYSKRVYVQSNGNRMGLDFLYGIKYYLGDDTRNDKLGADAYAGYAFTFHDKIDGVNVFKSKYDSSIGFLYDKYIKESEFYRLSRLEREQALLQALVVPDDELQIMDESMEIKASDVEIDIKDIPYEIVETEGVKVEGNVFIAEGEDSSITIRVQDVKNSQLIVSFDNLRRLDSEGNIIGNFVLKCSNAKLKAEANNKKNNQTIPGIVDFDLNMGHYEDYSDDLKIRFNKKGRYEYDRLYISAMSTELFDKYANERCKSVYKVNEKKSNKLRGNIDARTDGYLFLSIPINTNWNVYIDGGQVAEVHNANIAFFATPITKGIHNVELRYDHTNRNIALAITTCGLILMIILSLIDRKRRGSSLEKA